MFAQTLTGNLLHEEHVQTINTLQRLEEFLVSQTPKRIPDMTNPDVRKIFEKLLKNLASEVNRHFGFEENHLFPYLAEQGETGMAAVLMQEHAVILPMAQELAAMGQAALDGTPFTAQTWREFHERGLELCEREMFHIQKEEMGLLAAIGAFIDSDADAQLAMIYQSMTD